MEIPLKIKKKRVTYHMILQSHSWPYIQRKHLKRYMHPNVLSSTIDNSQDMEAT